MRDVAGARLTTDDLTRRIEGWRGESVVVAREPETDTWMFIALHDTRMGPAVGGTRMKTYSTLGDGLLDALRLAEGMTYKWAGVGIPFGGGKAVLATRETLTGDRRHRVLERYGRLLGSLRGAFRTGVDLGTTPEDMKVVSDAAPYVMGILHGHSTDPGPFTALGVLAGIRAALQSRFGTDSLEGRSVLIQGVGDVGQPLAEMLADAGARLVMCDIDEDTAGAWADRLGGTVVAPADMAGADVDIYAPCAVGATVNPETVPLLRCHIVAGSANNQLATSEDADRLHERGILYAPDYIINAGGAIAFGRMQLGVTEGQQLRSEVEAIGDTLAEVFEEAAAAKESPVHAAQRRAERFLATRESGSA
jgi:leucine dehydrogenase